MAAGESIYIQPTPMNTQIQEQAAESRKAPSGEAKETPATLLRVLHVIPRLGLGGTENGVLKIIRGLGADKFEHRICAVRGIDADFAKREGLESKAYSVASSRAGFQFPLFRLKRIMREFRPHIVHSRNFGALEAVPAARIARVPVAIHSEHGYELEIVAGLPLRRRILYRALCGMADALFTVTDDLRTYHSAQSWLPVDRFRVIYNGVNTEKFAPEPNPGAAIRSEFGIPASRFVAGSVGRLVAIKDHITLLRATEILAKQGKNVHALIVGDGPELKNLQAYAAASSALAGRITFAGSSNRVHELLHAMNAFVLSSICEGMSNTILEAMSCGLPVVATRTGGNAELVEEGRSGYLFTPGNVEALSALLSRIAEDAVQAREIGMTARRRAAAQFSIAGMIQRYQELYTELASRKGVKEGQ